MPSHAKKEIFLKDYQPPVFLIATVEMDIDIRDKEAVVTTRMEVSRNAKSRDKKMPLILKGEAQKLLNVTVDGRELSPKDYKLTPHDLTIPLVKGKAVVEIVSSHDPYNNTALMGLYKAGPMLNTQNEPEGFRRITYHPDRSDVMSKYRATIHADKKTFPVLLANGNLIASGNEDKGRHFAVWEDPFLKPSYLFAMVAGKLDKVTSTFKTMSGRKVLLEIYVVPGKTDQVGFAMTALKNAMKWDEKTFGLEYDLDRFMIVGTPFFNMGAMENKGLNIFNDTCLLGTAQTATDGTISFIEAVVGHEYFHNWTGDRITCRDWFQLSLKEGLTVYRDQEFSSDMNSRAVERLGNVRVLRRAQFAEDAGAMAHPVQPASYQEIDNFYTVTVYEKGAEVVRMYRTLCGVKGFRKGMDLYVKRHDGQAVTCQDFLAAMNDANKGKFDSKQFALWYSQSGTPRLDVTSAYDAKKKTLTLSVKQSCPPTPKQKTKQPFYIPLAVGLLDSKGRDTIGTQVLVVDKAKQNYTFKNVAPGTVPSLLRDFSAPVILNYPYTDEQLLFLLANDTDPFCKWEAGFKLATKCLLALANGKAADCRKLVGALRAVLRDKKLDPAFKAMMLSLPTEAELGMTQRADGKTIMVDELYAARRALSREIATNLHDDISAVWRNLKPNDKASDGKAMGDRSLRNLCLAYLVMAGDKAALNAAYKQVTASKNMTDQVAALSVLTETDSPLKTKALKAFEKRWSKEPNIMDKWLSVQAMSKQPGTLAQVRKLMAHKAFDIKNPNRVSALLGVAAGNGALFHAKDGSGYKFIADMILKVDAINAHSAARIVKVFAQWRDYDKKRQGMMQAELKRMAKAKLSANCAEIVAKSLKS